MSPLSGNFRVGTGNKCIDLFLVGEMIKRKIWNPLLVMFPYHVEEGTLTITERECSEASDR